MKRTKANEPQQVSNKETEVLLSLLEETLDLKGDVVELGCYRGDTSVLFERKLEETRRNNPEKPLKFLWIYDSFEGLPEKSREDNSVAGDQFKAGELLVSKREAIEKFKKAGLKIPRIRKGFFEELDSEKDLPEKISFAFLDGDLYQSIKTSLKLVENRMSEQGIIVVHDYNNPELPGSSRAVDEWLRKHPEKQLEVKETLAIIK
ncbi:class I SAM-dependent methyltransferase [Candidatus Saccharibacteria bacterium]|nr:class I SAM-dependent methyltransferase [Candidatus Saccharibacteria bacterium]